MGKKDGEVLSYGMRTSSFLIRFPKKNQELELPFFKDGFCINCGLRKGILFVPGEIMGEKPRGGEGDDKNSCMCGIKENVPEVPFVS